MPAMLAISTDSGAQDQNPNLSFVGSSHAHRQITGNQQGVLIGGKAAEQTWACVDIGLMLGRSSRPGWGPGGTLVRSVVSSTESSVLQTQIRFSNAVKHCHYIRGDQDAVQRCHARLVGSLQAHQKFSTRQSCTPGSLVPVRGLKCTRDRSSLSAVCNHFNQRALTAHESTSDESEKIVLAHEMGAWQLLVELFSDVDCSDVNRHATSTADMESLKNVRRKGLVSNLLRQLVRTTVQAAVVEAQTLEEVVLLWLTGHELGPALSAAASRGDVRLATLIAASGSGIAPIKHATSHQLDLWLAEGLDDHIAPMRLAIFKLLAGHIAETARAVQLDWRRSLGLYLWYGIPRTAPMQDVLHSYLDDVFRGDAEPPLPSYVAGTAEEQPHCGGSFFPDDVWFSMMILKAGMAHKATAQGRHNCDEISNILHPAGHTPDPLDHTFNWLLACVLQSIGAFEPFGISRGALATSVDTFFRLVSAVVAHAELLGEPMLAIYVACHIPDHPHKPGLRDRVVRQLLLRHVYFLQSHEDEHHLVSELGIPAAWIADALALKARYEKHNFEEIRQLIRAGSHDAAHNILIKDLAPTFFVYGMHQVNHD